MANTIGQKELRRDWPCVTGINADSKHEGRISNLVPQITKVSSKDKIGLS